MKIICLVCCLFIAVQSFARHGKGGFITYQYLGTGSATNTSQYQVTIAHYVDCNSPNLIETNVYLGIFDGATGSLVKTVTIPITSQETVQKISFNPCINPTPTVCFFYITYVTTVELLNNTGGYVLADQECCRINGIVNISNSSSYGITNTNSIPGIINNVSYRTNNSAVFAQKDTVVICFNAPFVYDFSATDADGDSLSYAFCAAKAGATSGMRQPNPPAPPPYSDLPYQSGYTAEAPLGNNVKIDSRTGIITGTAPSTRGTYVLSVCVSEFRNGIQIGSTKKEVHVTVADCSLTAASLKTSYVNCDNFIFTFQNETTASNIDSYYWDFGVGNSATDTSTLPTPTFTYADTGTYPLKLKVSTINGCSDSADAIVKVYPGFAPGFTASGSCYQSPFLFNDTTYVRYGSIDNRNWDFGDLSSTTDISSAKNPAYQYPSPGTATIVLNVTSSKGCSGSFSKIITINDKPAIYLPFTDTLICSIDSLPLLVQTNSASYTWRPLYNIINPNSASPVVFPKDTTVYTVIVNEKGCIDSGHVTVNVLDKITVSIISDTAICSGDGIILKPVSEALTYRWTEIPASNSLNNYTTKYPVASPLATTTYHVTANLGYCVDSANIKVNVSPYPIAFAGNDTIICSGDRIQLKGSTTAAYFTWSPLNSLLNPSVLKPVAAPIKSTDYTLTVRDTFYCPKSVSDTVIVVVIQPAKINAGNDTLIVIGQPLQLQATYEPSYSYLWSPVVGMNNPNIYNPLITINSTTVDSINYRVRASTPEGCTSTDFITVKIFRTGPDIFVPSAFTPNYDGKNDILKPFPVGIAKFDYFKLFNRWGQLVYTTTESNKGWDGNVSGIPQPTGTFVYTTQGTDFRGKAIFRKGTVVLIR